MELIMAAWCCLQGVAGVGVAVPSSSALVRLWAHEAMRVFHDRLVSTEDRSWFCGALQQAVDKHWPQANFSQVFPPKEGQEAQVWRYCHRSPMPVLHEALVSSFVTHSITSWLPAMQYQDTLNPSSF